MFDTVVLADDLSGAADCAVAYVHRGLQALVTLGELSDDLCADVISIDADTRRLDAATAAARMNSLTTAFAGGRDTQLFKKVDSSLRGHVGVELAAVLQARRATGNVRTVAVMAPALPASGRTVRGGSVYVNDTPLHETELWRHQETVGEVHIPHMLRDAGLSSIKVELAEVRGMRLEEAMREASSRCDVLLCDAVTEEDLELVASAGRRLDSDVIWVGSAGLAHHLAYSSPVFGCETVPSPPLGERARPVLFVVGSMCRTARTQLAVLASSGAVCTLTIPSEILMSGQDSAELRSLSIELHQALRQGRDVVLAIATVPVLPVTDRPHLSRALAAVTAGLRPQVGALVACGGETARMVLECWQVSGLRLLGELERGVAVSTAIDSTVNLTVVTKAGDFGTPETLLRCQRWLHVGKEVHQ